MKSDHLHLNSDKTQFIWVGSRQQLASVSVTEIVLNGFSIKTSPIVTCLGVKIDADCRVDILDAREAGCSTLFLSASPTVVHPTIQTML